ncbi:MAG: hypothetical protein AAF770_00760 [Bacteroidota bacterium]
MNKRALFTKPVTFLLVTLACMLGFKQVAAKDQEFDIEKYDLFFLRKSNMNINSKKRYLGFGNQRETTRDIMVLHKINSGDQYVIFSENTKIRVNSIKNLVQTTITSDDAKGNSYQISVIQGSPTDKKDKEAAKESELSIPLMRMHQEVDSYSPNRENVYYLQYNVKESFKERNPSRLGLARYTVSKNVPMSIIVMAKMPSGAFKKDFVKNFPNKAATAHNPSRTYGYTKNQSDELRAIFSASIVCYYVTKEQQIEKKQINTKEFKASKTPWEGKIAFEFTSIARDVNAKTLNHPKKNQEYKYIVDIKNTKKGLVWTQKVFTNSNKHSNSQALAYIQDLNQRNNINTAMVQVEDNLVNERLVFKKGTDPRDFDLFSIETTKSNNIRPKYSYIALKESSEVLKKYPSLRSLLWSILAQTIVEPTKKDEKHVRYGTMYAGLRANTNSFGIKYGNNKLALSDEVEDELRSEPADPNTKEVQLVKYKHYVFGITTNPDRTDYIHSINVSINVPNQNNTKIFKFFAAHKALIQYLVWHYTPTDIKNKKAGLQRSWNIYDHEKGRYITAAILEATIRNAKIDKSNFKYSIEIPNQSSVSELTIEILKDKTKIQETLGQEKYEVNIAELNHDAFNDVDLYDNKNEVETSDEEPYEEESFSKEIEKKSPTENQAETREEEEENEQNPNIKVTVSKNVVKQETKNMSNNRPWTTNVAYIVVPFGLAISGVAYAASGKNQRKSEDHKGVK